MNDHDPLEEALTQFRNTQPPEAVRGSNRATVRAALEQVGMRLPWWRRTISLPLPVVLATAAALLISVAAHLLAVVNNTAPGSRPPSEPSTQGDGSGPSLIAATDPRIEYFETQRYMSGIGVIDRNVSYRFGD
jgi:hypothetical protein